MDFCLLFVAGFLQDILFTSAQKCAQRDYFIRAALLAGVIGVVNILVVSTVVATLKHDGATACRLGCFAVGKACGSYTSLRILAWRMRVNRPFNG